jgi:hypothetical protein
VKGHIRERSPGYWAIVLGVRDPETGKRKRKWHRFTGKKRQAQTECSRLITEMESGCYLEPTKITLGHFLDKWLDHMRSQLAPRSHERYSDIARKNLAPLRNVTLTKLRPLQISNAYVGALESGRRDGKGGLTPSTVVYMHRVLREALNQAVIC